MRRSLLVLVGLLAVAVLAPVMAHSAVPAQADVVRGSTGPGLDTMERRELRLELSDLDGAQRSRTAALLARPGQNRQQCFTTVCVHWFTTGAGRATQAYVEQVAATAEQVLEIYAAAGYRAPKSDGTRGGNDLLDIYLQNLGGQGLYGYCDTDSAPTGDGPWDAPAYCAFDNDYREFTSHTPLENLQVTAAHELFHAVQFAYDYLEDVWFMESTATWAEDEVFDDVDDNVQYLRSSPLKQPAVPLDKDAGLRVYGGWIFFRYLTERHPDAEGDLPVLVREMWERADGSADGPDDYSIRAVKHVLAAHGGGLRGTWARFAAANRQPGVSYDEGRASRYPTARLAGTVDLSAARRASGPITKVVDHLSAATIRFNRAPGLAARTLRLTLDLPPTTRGSGAVATVHPASGRATTISLTPSLKANGNAVVKVPFDRGVARVEVTLANAGVRYRSCGQGTSWSCQGRPADDDLPFRVRAIALR
ncbi:MXAN_6640 family putative metalloprotease [Nocardioides pyridinolyticus]